MRIKKYLAATMQEGKLRVSKELGEDAIILSTRAVRDPSNPSAEMIEIVAALENLPVKKDTEFPEQSGLEASSEISSRIETQTSQFIQATSQIYNELYRLKEILFNIQDSVKYKYSGILGERFGSLYINLRKLDFSEEFSLNIIGQLSSLGQNLKQGEIIEKCKEIILDKIQFSSQITKKNQSQIFAFTGPTGSGKTTTIEKLAIICKLVLNGNVLIVSTDTQKIGGSEQLQTFASIASIPFRAVYSPNELMRTLSQEHDKDFIFIDTTGRNPQNIIHLNEISEFLEIVGIDHTYLVLNSNINRSSLKQLINLYKKIGYTSIILSKADESHGMGEFVETLHEAAISLSYITTGQQIPDDIEPATKNNISKYIFRGILL